jgi:hypothetical protein
VKVILIVVGRRILRARTGGAASLILQQAPCARGVPTGTRCSTKASRLCRVVAGIDGLSPGPGEVSGRWLLSRGTPGPACQALLLRYGCWQTGRSRCVSDAGLIRAFATGVLDLRRLTKKG